MNGGQIEEAIQARGTFNPGPHPISLELKEEIHSDRRLSYASKLFPLNSLVTVLGKEGIYRIVSAPYIPRGYSYPHFDVEAFGERFSANVFTTTRICN